MFRRLQHLFNQADSYSPDIPMEMRLFQMVSLLATVLSIGVILPICFFQNLPLPVTMIVILYGMGAYYFYRQACKGRCHYLLFLIQLVVAINVVWFLDGGSQGGVIFYFFSAAIYCMVVFNARKRKVLIGFLLLNGAALLIVEYFCPDAVMPFVNAEDRLFEQIKGFIISSLSCILVIRVVLSCYDQERRKLIEVNAQLNQSLSEIKTLRGLLPICAWCKKIRDDEGLWKQLEIYVIEHTDADFSHSICPECNELFLKEHGISGTKQV